MFRAGLVKTGMRLGGIRSGSGVSIEGLRSTAEIQEAQNPDPGPPCTYDDIPIPFKPYQEEYSRQQGKFNTILAASATFFSLTLAYGLYNNIWSLNAGQPPKAYSQRLPRSEKSYEPY